MSAEERQRLAARRYSVLEALLKSFRKAWFAYHHGGVATAPFSKYAQSVATTPCRRLSPSR